MVPKSMFQNTKRVRDLHDKPIPAGGGGMDIMMTIFEIAIQLEVSDPKPNLLRSKKAPPPNVAKCRTLLYR